MNIAIIPIRDDSTRLPRKATGLKLYKNYTPLECIIKRLNYSKSIDQIIFIMPDMPENDNIVKIINKYKNNKIPLSSYKGSINDISGRALEAIDYNVDNTIINITADCPLVDPFQIDFLIKMYGNKKTQYNNDFPAIYVSNVITRSFPDGFDIQVYDGTLLEVSRDIAINKKITTNMGWDIVNYSGYIQDHFKMFNYPATEEFWYPEWGLTLDYKEDSELLKIIYKHFDRFDFTYQEVIDFLKQNPNLLEINKNCRRNIPGE